MIHDLYDLVYDLEDDGSERHAEQAGDLRAALAELERLRGRVAELEAGEVRTEWGVRTPDGIEHAGGPLAGLGSREHVEVDAENMGGKLIQREVRRGPWTEVSP